MKSLFTIYNQDGVDVGQRRAHSSNQAVYIFIHKEGGEYNDYYAVASDQVQTDPTLKKQKPGPRWIGCPECGDRSYTKWVPCPNCGYSS